MLVEALKFYANAEYHFDACSKGAKELFDDDGDTAKQALAALPEEYR